MMEPMRAPVEDRKIAERCATRIRNYWQQRGLSPEVWTEVVPLDSHRAPSWGIRSNMIGGMPPARLVPAPAPAPEML